MYIFNKNRFYSVIILLLIFLLINVSTFIKDIHNYEPFSSLLKAEEDELSLVINVKNLTKIKHNLLYGFIKKLNNTRNYYFVKTIGNPLDENLNQIVENSSIKIIQSNFPDSIFLPLVVSLYGNTIPDYVLFIEEEDLMSNFESSLLKWIIDTYKNMKRNNYDYVFGNFKFISGKKIGCSLLFSKASIIEHLLYYTDSDTTHANPFVQLSFATKTKFCFIPFTQIKLKTSKLENIYNKFSLNMNCPLINDSHKPSLCILLPAFKRDYFSFSFHSFSKQTYLPKFYIVIQNENRIHLNLSLIQKIVKEPIYHIWMQNWNSFFFLNLRFSSVLPCDFILKYDDDQWPRDNTVQEKLILNAKNKNIIIGKRGYAIKNSFCGYSPKNFKRLEIGVVDHSAVPIFMRPGYIKLDARHKIYRLYGGEDIHLSLNSWKLCNVTSKRMGMNAVEKQKDGNSQRADKQIISAYRKEKETNFNLFENTYCYLIRSGYLPKRWSEFQIPQKDYLNITLEHKRLN